MTIINYLLHLLMPKHLTENNDITTTLVFDVASGYSMAGKGLTSDGAATVDLLNCESQTSGGDGSFTGGNGQSAGGYGGNFQVNGGNAHAEGDGNGGNVELNGGEASGSGVGGKVKIASSGGWQANLDTDSLSAARNISFPDASGTIALETAVSGSFTTVDGKTVTIVNGVVTAITA